ncbi:MAG: hypothetical protein KFB97_10870 [Cyanobium sp. M30B3]|jgi:hypothetical protein|nr:MAG: hypothetical protein KFB97_10870 [Cyanobium sp. M30B3]
MGTAWLLPFMNTRLGSTSIAPSPGVDSKPSGALALAAAAKPVTPPWSTWSSGSDRLEQLVLLIALQVDVPPEAIAQLAAPAADPLEQNHG